MFDGLMGDILSLFVGFTALYLFYRNHKLEKENEELEKRLNSK